MKQRVIVIGLDGGSFNLLKPWMDQGVLSNLKQIETTGISAPLRSSIPPVTCPAWPCFMTGKNPGKHGVYLHEAANGRDDSPVVTESEPRSISQENTFDTDTRDLRRLEKELAWMSAGVAKELEREGYLARTIVLKLRYGDFTTITRQRTLAAPTAGESEIFGCAAQLLHAHWERGRAVRLIGVGVHNLVQAGGAWQLALGL